MARSSAMQKQSMSHSANTSSDGRFQIITPPRALLDLVTIRPLTPGAFDALKSAENQLMLIEHCYPQWLEEEVARLKSSWEALRNSPTSSEAFKTFHCAVHAVRGNGTMLGCPAASELATPLARYLERNPTIEQHLAFLELGTTSICLAVSQNLPADDPYVKAVVESMMQIVERWRNSTSAN